MLCISFCALRPFEGSIFSWDLVVQFGSFARVVYVFFLLLSPERNLPLASYSLIEPKILQIPDFPDLLQRPWLLALWSGILYELLVSVHISVGKFPTTLRGLIILSETRTARYAHSCAVLIAPLWIFRVFVFVVVVVVVFIVVLDLDLGL